MSLLDQIDLNALSIFDAVVQAKSFTAAADRLGVAKAKISVQISRLEKQLGTALFTRTTRQVTLTEAGRNLHEQCQPLLLGLRDALTQVGSEQGELTGLLRVSASVTHASQSVAPALARFAVKHPHLRIDLRTGDRISDLVADGIDLSFRVGWLRDSSQRAIKLGEFRQFVLAAPGYLKKHGTPKQPQELSEHAWVALSLLPTPLTWKFNNQQGQTHTVHMKSRLQVDAPSALLGLIEQGAGISTLEEVSAIAAIKAGKLIQLLPDWSLPTGGIYAVLPPGRHVPARVRAFIDFYREFIGG
jgi:DNA-binding transcriptional LysR family regulator